MHPPPPLAQLPKLTPQANPPPQILSPAHLLTPTFLALHAFLSPAPKHKTLTPHSELVFRLSPNNNIGESYRTFGISASTTALIAVKLPITAAGERTEVTREGVSAFLGRVVEGRSVAVGELGTELGGKAEVHRIKKVYKIGCAKGKGRGREGEVEKDDRRDLESVILGAMALKGS